MTYFLRDDNGPIDAGTWLEIVATRELMIQAANRGCPNDGSGCLFPDEHDPRHPVDMRFHIELHDEFGRGQIEWEELTEDEIAARLAIVDNGWIASSTFEFWWD